MTDKIPSLPSHVTSLPFPFSLALKQPTIDETVDSVAPPPLELIAQGAESRLYRTTFLSTISANPIPYLSDSSRARPVASNRPSSSLPAGAFTNSSDTAAAPLDSALTSEQQQHRPQPEAQLLPAALKHRPSKPWRHPTLDARLTRSRLQAEARALVRARRAGARVPGVLAVDPDQGVLVLEWIPGKSVKELLHEILGRFGGVGTTGDDDEKRQVNKIEGKMEEELKSLMTRVGESVGKLHEIGIVHGDLTTSNLMLRPPSAEVTEKENGPLPSLDGDIFIIDFGLVSQSIQDEDKAVDLYVLERAFASTHPAAEELFQDVLEAYRKSHKASKSVLKRLADVRMRGRKKSMIG